FVRVVAYLHQPKLPMTLHEARLGGMDRDVTDMARRHAAADDDSLRPSPIGPAKENPDHVGKAFAELDGDLAGRPLFRVLAFLENMIDVAFRQVLGKVDPAFPASF